MTVPHALQRPSGRLEPRRVLLPTGLLDITVARADWPLDALCGFAARNNPKRGFLVVSKVLGRHIGTRPDVMRRSARDLAARLPADLPGPVLVVGLAETAICLGQTVHEEYRALTGRDDLVFIHSTRQQIDHPLLCRFEEPHSHASAHLIYRPGFAPPRSLVLVDDELSTGTTLTNLAGALVGVWPRIEAIVTATLTDWSGGSWRARMPRPTQGVALLAGSLSWRASSVVSTFEEAPAKLGRLARHRNTGRLGVAAPLALDCPPPPPGSAPLRVIGTGECSTPAFRIAEAWQQEGRDVIVQATSRSPARIGSAIRSMLRFADNYGTGVPNFLYNADDARENWIVAEPGTDPIDPALMEALRARLVVWA